MNNKKTLERIEKRIKKLTYKLDNNIGIAQDHKTEIFKLQEFKESIEILKNNGLEFSYVNQFNTEDHGVNTVKAGDGNYIDLKREFNSFVVTKYEKCFRDCENCGKSKDKFEIQIHMPELHEFVCLECFEEEMREWFFLENCNFQIIELSEDIADYKYEFSYNSVGIGFDTFTYYPIKNQEDLYYIDFYQTVGLCESRKVSSLMNFKLSKQELNFLKTQYDLKPLKQEKKEVLEDESYF